MALDLFAGSGGLGIESLSRGQSVLFLLRKILKHSSATRKYKKCRYEEYTELFRIDAKRAVKALLKRDITFKLIFRSTLPSAGVL